MNSYDPLDWTHQWAQFEMMMYALYDGPKPGIFMQVSELTKRDGADEWAILYDRCIASLGGDVQVPLQPEAWEEQVLRHHLNVHPELVNEEKVFLSRWLESREVQPGEL